MRRVLLFLLLVLPAVSASGARKVIIIAGAGGLPEYQERFASQAQELRQLLEAKFGYGPQDILLFAEVIPGGVTGATPCTSNNIRQAFLALQQQMQPRDELIVFLLGHGTFDGDWAKLNITGPDLRDVDFADLLDGLRTEKILFINLSSASGPFLQKLSRPGRIVITATRNGEEKNATQFPQYFLHALQKGEEADLDKDGHLSVTEAFVMARDELVRYYDEKRQLRPEHPLLDDDGDGAGNETPDLLAGDGARARLFYFENRVAQPPAASRSGQPGNREFVRRQQEILAEVHALQERKSSMAEEDYYRQFEKLMVKLAELNASQKRTP